MPVSKKRKPQKRRNSSPIRSSASGSSVALAGGAGSKKKLSRQQIIIYVVSIAMILSLAIGYLVGNSPPSVPPAPTIAPIAEETPAPVNSGTAEAELTPTVEPTEAN